MIEELEELEEELENPILECYISFEESTMVGEGEGEVHNVKSELGIGGGRGREEAEVKVVGKNHFL